MAQKMIVKLRDVLFSTMCLLFCAGSSDAQHGAVKVGKNPFHEAYHDSLKAMKYNYTFPFLGQKAYRKGFDIPFAWGVGLAYYVQHQRVIISQTQISFDDGQPIDLSSIIQYGNIENNTWATTIRPNLWILPFLNVYLLEECAEPSFCSTLTHVSNDVQWETFAGVFRPRRRMSLATIS